MRRRPGSFTADEMRATAPAREAPRGYGVMSYSKSGLGSAYTQPSNFTFGNSGPGVVRGPGATIFNLSLGKSFSVTEHKRFEIRGEAFNLANTPIFNSPISQTITSATFGEISTTTGER